MTFHITPADLRRFTDDELRALFRHAAERAAGEPEDSLARRNALAALDAIGKELGRRQALRFTPKPGP